MHVSNITRLLFTVFLYVLQACSVPSCGSIALPASDALPPDHQAWTLLLQKYVDEQGMVDYRGFAEDRPAVQAYLASLQVKTPARDWSAAEQLAYWINAYNAFTVELVLEHYPLQSIKDIGSEAQLPFVNTPWVLSSSSWVTKPMTLIILSITSSAKGLRSPVYTLPWYAQPIPALNCGGKLIQPKRWIPSSASRHAISCQTRKRTTSLAGS